jgi:hypothetical protein
MDGVERVWHRRLRWRLRGAWMWPAFCALTLIDGVLLVVLPPYEGAPPAVFPGVLLALFVNLLAVAVVAPLAGLALRRRRRDLPRRIAADYAGTWLLVGISGLLVVAGLAHRPGAAAEDDRRQAVAKSVHDYVITSAPEFKGGLGHIDAIRQEPDHYRACVPGADDRHSLCLFVRTDQSPPGITRDTSQVPNSEYRLPGG